MQRNHGVDFMRFVFALVIVIAHLRVLTRIPELESTRFLSLIVNRTAFFVISGFRVGHRGVARLRSFVVWTLFAKRICYR